MSTPRGQRWRRGRAGWCRWIHTWAHNPFSAATSIPIITGTGRLRYLRRTRHRSRCVLQLVHFLSMVLCYWYLSSLDPYRSSCSAVIARYHHNSAPPYLGFNTEQGARSSFAAFQAPGQLPQGLFFRPLRPLVGLPAPVQSLHPSTPQHHGMTPTSPTSRSTLSPPSTTFPRAPNCAASQMRSVFETQPTSSSPSRVRPSPSPSSLSLIQCNATSAPAPAAARQPSSSHPLLAPVVESHLFYVVIEGDAPGVYGLQ